jgi:hypothetical protein
MSDSVLWQPRDQVSADTRPGTTPVAAHNSRVTATVCFATARLPSIMWFFPRACSDAMKEAFVHVTR